MLCFAFLSCNVAYSAPGSLAALKLNGYYESAMVSASGLHTFKAAVSWHTADSVHSFSISVFAEEVFASGGFCTGDRRSLEL